MLIILLAFCLKLQNILKILNLKIRNNEAKSFRNFLLILFLTRMFKKELLCIIASFRFVGIPRFAGVLPNLLSITKFANSPFERRLNSENSGSSNFFFLLILHLNLTILYWYDLFLFITTNKWCCLKTNIIYIHKNVVQLWWMDNFIWTNRKQVKCCFYFPIGPNRIV